MPKRTAILLTAMALLLGCGKKTTEPEDESLLFKGARVTESAADLPDCDTDHEGQLFYVLEDQEFNYCDGDAYMVIDLTGPQGDSGAQGEPGQDGADGQDGISINWLGSLDADPDDASLNDAYYNTADGVAYLWDGSGWQLLVQDGVSCTATSIPEGVEVSCGGEVIDTVEHGQDGADGTNGTDGADGTDGASCTATSITEGVEVSCNGKVIDTVEHGQDGVKGDKGDQGDPGSDGTDGKSILWQGSHASAPAAPDTNWAYYNSTDGVAYIFNGSSWDTMSISGFDYSNLACPDGYYVAGFDASGNIICGILPLFQVLYDGNGHTSGNVPVDSFFYRQGESATLLGNTGAMQKTGNYRFNGWNIQPDGNGTGYPAGGTMVIGRSVAVLYAVWDSVYSLTYDGNGQQSGTVPADDSLYLTGERVVVLGNPGNLQNDWYTFGGWYDAVSETYIAGKSFVMGTADVILYAIWNDTLMDMDGNVYHTIQIGNQVWTVENWRSTTYTDGNPIPNITDGTTWDATTQGAYCFYNNTTNQTTQETYGALYNWYAVDSLLAPEGWHVATDAEWTALQNYLITHGYNWDGTTSGNKIAKSLAAQSSWTANTTQGTPGNNLSANNSTGFSGLATGFRSLNGGFMLSGTIGRFWTATGTTATRGWFRYLSSGAINLYREESFKRYGFSVRLVRD